MSNEIEDTKSQEEAAATNMAPEKQSFSVDPEEVEEKVAVAPSIKRIMAFSIDYIIIMILVRSLYPLMLPNHWDLVQEDGIGDPMIMMLSLGAILFILKDISFGKSIGKSFLNLYVARVADEFPPATVSQNIMRNLFLLILPIEALKMVFDPYLRRFGDKAAGTTVLEIKRPFVVRRFTIKVLGGMLVVTSLWSITVNLQSEMIKKSYSYQIAKEAVLADRAVQNALGEIKEVGYWQDAEQKLGMAVYTLTLKGEGGERKVQAVISGQGREMQVAKVTLLEKEIEGSKNNLEEE